ncbi:universal stress protein [Microbacterium aurugineum]|nr:MULTISPECIES: universal stress protein [unclassified Microbacterium]MCE0508903.1 universal stress protein [Microbacterium sp. KKR3/1]UUE21322.1 universal stress protein [Microbacterium sp. J1-1]
MIENAGALPIVVGSVSAACASHARCPVLVVQAPAG